jgi:AcrR family transcriptional regulator
MAESSSRRGPFDPPTEPRGPSALARLPVGRHGLPREFIEANQRNRLLAAALEVFTGRGYAASSIADVIKLAGVSRNTFYAHFADKEACFLAAYDVVVSWLTERAGDAAHRADGWARVAVAVIDELTRLLAADPRLARLCTVEIFQAGSPAARRHRALTERLASALRDGREVGAGADELPAILDEVLVGGAISVLAEAVIIGEAERLAELGPELSEVLLFPYLGLTAARELVAEASRT